MSEPQFSRQSGQEAQQTSHIDTTPPPRKPRRLTRHEPPLISEKEGRGGRDQSRSHKCRLAGRRKDPLRRSIPCGQTVLQPRGEAPGNKAGHTDSGPRMDPQAGQGPGLGGAQVGRVASWLEQPHPRPQPVGKRMAPLCFSLRVRESGGVCVSVSHLRSPGCLCLRVFVCVSGCFLCVCVCVCVRERERERDCLGSKSAKSFPMTLHERFLFSGDSQNKVPAGSYEPPRHQPPLPLPTL